MKMKTSNKTYRILLRQYLWENVYNLYQKRKKFQTNDTCLYLNKLETSKHIDPKVSTRMETIEIKTEINEVEMRKTVEEV